MAEDPNHVYAGLLTTLLRLVFILYAEDRGLLSNDPIDVNHYSVTGLFDRLRADAGRFPDTMDQRYGAWAQLLVLFRIVFDGAEHGGFHIPGREGYLFDPDRYPFLEGRPKGSRRDAYDKLDVPRVSDGVIYRVLKNLLILDGERLSYRTLDVEQIGSVYETIMGFDLEVATGPSIAIKPVKHHGAPTTIDLEQLLAEKPANRAKWIRDTTDQKLTAKAAEPLKKSETINDLLAALEKKIARKATPNVVPKSAMVLQPSDERRRSGSHYTPRSLTEPIVRKTLEPILKRLGGKPTSKEILDLKVCDPAMGSGAFLVEACRQLGDALVKAWYDHDCLPSIPPDEDELLHARRIIAQRCLYGVDKNPMAVDLAKLSLWLATLAKDHPFTFLDHALRCGDSLVGLSRQQIADFHWKHTKEKRLGREHIEERIQRATAARKEILDAGDTIPPEIKAQRLAVADEALDAVRFFGDLCVAAFFAGKKDKDRKAKRDEYFDRLAVYLTTGDMTQRPSQQVNQLRTGERPVAPFHWEIEFPEVLARDNGGFEAIVGNPPFAGHVTVTTANRSGYTDWLRSVFAESGGKCDLVAFFFRMAYTLLRRHATFGLLATNTIGQGDTRYSGLRWICSHNGTIYAARKRFRWPGQAAVVVSVVHVCRGSLAVPFDLDGRSVPLITAYLFHAGGHDNPSVLRANASRSFQGSVIRGMGFTFDDTDTKGIASPLSTMHQVIREDRRNTERIFPYIGGEEVNESATHLHHRYVIDFDDMTEEEAARWPSLLEMARSRVLPARSSSTAKTSSGRILEKWWQYGHTAKELYAAISEKDRTLVISRVGQQGAFTFLPTGMVYADSLVVFDFDAFNAFAVMQARVHEFWTRFFASSMKDDLRYTPTDCFETFPFPEGFETGPALETAGKAYYEFRADLMVRDNEGLTKTYYRFHDPNEKSSDIIKLRELHDVMDRAVLDAYHWTDLQPTCEFLLDYEEEEDEPEPGKKPRKKKKPWRYRWPDDFRDEVLARLLDLNQKRAAEERLAGKSAVTEKSKRTRARKLRITKAATDNLDQRDLLSS